MCLASENVLYLQLQHLIQNLCHNSAIMAVLIMQILAYISLRKTPQKNLSLLCKLTCPYDIKIPCGKNKNNSIHPAPGVLLTSFESINKLFSPYQSYYIFYISTLGVGLAAPSTALAFLSGNVYALGERYDKHMASLAGPLAGQRSGNPNDEWGTL